MTIKTQPYLGERIAATIIDYFIIFGFSGAYGIILGVLDEEGSKSIEGPMAFVPQLFWFCWLIIAEAVWGKTLGHHLVGLKIVTVDGNKPLFWQALVRRLFDIVDFFICLPGLVAFILIQSTKNHQRLGDIVSKTLVVHKNVELQETAFDFEKPVQNQ